MKKILTEKIYFNRILESTVALKGECCMLSKYSDVYPCIDNKYHPNPGLAEDGFPEIELCIDWLIRYNLGNRVLIKTWIDYRINEYLGDNNKIMDITPEIVCDIAENVFYTDIDNLCEETLKIIKEDAKEIIDNYDLQDELFDLDEFPVAEKITNYINETFTRVRAGGKLDSYGRDEIYFRISSHGYDWYRVITDFLWDTFGDIKNMPKKICVCHDAETNPPEIILFCGTPEELFNDYDRTRFEHVEEGWM